jgi:hypothetical protein
MKIGSINYPDPLIRAIRRGELVVFAGAGVSMGKPAGLPNFSGLAGIIARETGEKKSDGESEDHFLGRLHKKGLPVHSLVIKALYTSPGSATVLHYSLLRLFDNVSNIRIVTTNFDPLFEEATKEIFGELTDVYRSPALPVGRNFTGIVHVHGSCEKPAEMVLTDADFGRAYLIEGWARRFLVDMFHSYAVMFVGYSHDDVVMHYLSRALPTQDSERRYALVPDGTDLGKWSFRGIQPLLFSKPREDDFSILADGVKALAEYVSQTLLDRRESLVAIASGMPPRDDESADQILDALTEESTTRFVLQAARKPAWIRWFDSRNRLDSLFTETTLNDIDKLFADWLVDKFALEYHQELMLLISRHQMTVGSWMWFLLGRKIGLNTETKLDKQTLSAWVSLLLATMPQNAGKDVLLWLGERCAEMAYMNGVLAVFDRMLAHRVVIKERVAWSDEESGDLDVIKFDVELVSPVDHWDLNEVYIKYIKPSLNQIAPPVLSISIREMEKRDASLASWTTSDSKWDSASFRRSAIEPHAQDRIRHPVDVLIDAARDSLVAVGESNHTLSDCWFDTLSKSGVPLVRRVFIHGLSERRDKAADDKFRFFIDRHALHDINGHHEIYRLIANLYSGLSEPIRLELIDLIMAYEWPDRNDERFAERTAREHFDWLQWLVNADPACKAAASARDKIVAEYPQFKLKKYPDLTHWMETGWVGPKSPYTVEELLGKPASEWSEVLLTFKGDEFLGPDRNGLKLTVREAAKKNLEWGLDLATILGKKSEWGSDLWKGLLEGWEEWSSNETHCFSVLGWLRTRELCEHHLYQMTRTLYCLVRDGGKSCATAILDEANQVAMALWPEVVNDTEVPDSSDDWLQLAINKSSGLLAEYWLDSISLWRKRQDPKPETLNDTYRSALNQMILEGTKASGLSLTILASQLAFLLNVDYDWTKANLLGCFDSANDTKRFQQTWHGFLIWGTLNPQVVKEIEPYLEKVLNCLDNELKTHRDRFIEFLAALICFYVSDPQEKWIPAFLGIAEPPDRQAFAMHIGGLLRGMNAEQQKGLWHRWMKHYWEKRLQGLPQALIPGETTEMAEWVPHLNAVFEEAVDLAVQMDPAEFDHSSVIYDLRKSNLVTDYPEAVVKLITYLLKARWPGYFWHGLNEIMAKLDRAKVSPNILSELDIGLAAKGFD